MSSQWILMLAMSYVFLLFVVAWATERYLTPGKTLKSLIYALSLGVYCSSWTFFGMVGSAVDNGWPYFMIYLGPILLLVFGWNFLRRLSIISNRNKVTSIADFIGSRYGKHQGLASMVTLVAVVGALPYIALQLKAVSMAWGVMEQSSLTAAQDGTASLVAALLMAWFVIMFGNRVIDGSPQHRGIVAAVAFESLVKLIAFLVLGLLALKVMGNPMTISPTPKLLQWPSFNANIIIQALLSMFAIVCLPRQFHIMMVEPHNSDDMKVARWVFPLYLLAFSMFAIPLALAGQAWLSGGGLSSDTYVLSLPIALDSDWIAALAFLGGLSAATGMVVVSVIALSLMISNEWIMPLWLKFRSSSDLAGEYLGFSLRLTRRSAIVVVFALGWLLERQLNGGGLASIGLVAFAAASQLMPAIVGGLYWPRGHRTGVIWGLLVGFLLWCYCLLLPAVLGEGHGLLEQGPWGISWLSPVNLFGTGFLDVLSHGAVWSLSVNVLVFVLVSNRCRFTQRDMLQASAFTQLHRRYGSRSQDLDPTDIEIRSLQTLVRPLLGTEASERLWQDFESQLGRRLLPNDRAERFIVRDVENKLAGLIGAASAHQSIELLKKQRPLQVDEFVSLVGQTSETMRFSQALLQTTLENVPQGISVVDQELKLVAWNHRYEELFGYPSRLLYVGCPIEKVYRFNAERGYLTNAESDVDAAVNRRVELLGKGENYRMERQLPNGLVIEISGTAMDNGGYVTTYTDISDYHNVLDELERAKQGLEARVALRTAELSNINANLRRENDLRARIENELKDVHASKSRFLATASHDLLQPVNASRLFVSALQQQLEDGVLDDAGTMVKQLDASLASVEKLIDSMRQIARLESGKLTPSPENFQIGELLQTLVAEFMPVAESKGISLRVAACESWVCSDRQMLRQIVQNFLGNAIRYTQTGKVLVGCRRLGKELRVEVWDTGPGIAEADRSKVFEEFERLSEASGDRVSQRGLGLGLAIAQRTASLLGHSLDMASWPGQGSVFKVTVPVGVEQAQRRVRKVAQTTELAGMRVLCIDNEQAILAGMQALLQRWGCHVVTGMSLRDVLQNWKPDAAPDIILADYHLDNNETGVEVIEALKLRFNTQIPAIIISADNRGALREDIRGQGYLFLAKPVYPAALRTGIRRVLMRRSA